MTETMELKPMPDEIYCRKTWPDGGNWAAVPFMGVTRYIRADLAQPSAPADVVEGLVKALREIMDLQGEINPSNYDHDDVCKLNSSFVESWTIANAAIAAYEASLQPTEKG